MELNAFRNVFFSRNSNAKIIWPEPESGWCCEHPEGRYWLPPYIIPILVRFWHIVAYVLWLDLFINIWTWIVSHNTKYLVPLQVLWEKSNKIMLSIDTKNIGPHLWKCKKNTCMNSSMRLIVSIFGGENVPQHLYTNIQNWPTFHGALLRSEMHMR